jgi:hypothetical protein
VKTCVFIYCTRITTWFRNKGNDVEGSLVAYFNPHEKTTCSTVLIEKLTVPYTVKKFPVVYGPKGSVEYSQGTTICSQPQPD